ncbi:MAG TPA: cell wall-binding repeat-containing protein [Acidimicrobiales bacterium]|nr:cell wall-binding repeat-containing protein [Acidimicrobiales bacterium]
MARRPPVLVALLALLVPALASAPGVADAWSRGPIRIAGADRYETAVRISSAAFTGGAEAVVLASGESFPDGLTAGPLAALHDAPVLLTTRDALPPITARELERLAPERVFVVGGTAAVADEVVAEIRAIAGVQPARIAGATRYETATAVASLFPAPAPIAFLASGADFPDALAGGAAAALGGAPLLLTPPALLPDPVRDELARLAPPEVLVLGGTSAVSDAAMAAIGGPARRLAGTDRYATAAAIATDRVGDATQVIIATGNAFPDALAAAPLARSFGAPVLLTSGCLPSGSLEFIRTRGWADVTVVGGTGAVPEFGLSLPCAPVGRGELAPGLTLDTHVYEGPTVVHLVGITRRAGWDLRATTASGELLSLLHTTDIARRLQSPVAVNGTFFNMANGDPSFALAVDGRLLKAPGAGGTVFGVDPTNPDAAFFASPDFEIAIEDAPVARVNSGAPSPGEIGMFTRELNRTIDVGSPYCRAALATVGGVTLDAAGNPTQEYRVEDVRCDQSVINPNGRDVVAALEGTPEGEVIAGFEAGETVTYRWRVHPGANGVSVVMGGNLNLVHGGQVSSDVTGNHGRDFTERAPRTAVCMKPGGALVLAVVDGRQPGYSVGWTATRLAQYLAEIGCLDALNLDGGGSTALAVDGVLANRPSGGSQRAVSTALFLSPR